VAAAADRQRRGRGRGRVHGGEVVVAIHAHGIGRWDRLL
jgi:hypothetical protein